MAFDLFQGNKHASISLLNKNKKKNHTNKSVLISVISKPLFWKSMIKKN